MTKQLLMSNDQECELSGDVNLKTVAVLYAESVELFKGKKEIVVNLLNVNSFDSAIISLLLSWIRFAKRQFQQNIVFKNMPEKLHFLIEEYKLSETIRIGS